MTQDSTKTVQQDSLNLLQQKEELLKAVTDGSVKDGVVDQVSKMSDWFEVLILKLINSIPAVIGALLALIIGLFVIRTILKILNNRFEKRNVDLSLRGFILSIVKFVSYALLFLSVIGNLGFETTAILGALSGLVLAAGLALQGSLSNFAGGVLILLFRPFEVGDYIENASGTEGTVEKIDLLYTTLSNSQGIKVFSPNGTLANSVIKNFTKISHRRFDYNIAIAYDINIKVVKDEILKILNNDPRVLKTPVPEIFVNELRNSSINLVVRAWADRSNYWEVRNSLQEEIKMSFEKAGISIALPPQEIIISSPTKES